jgi:hypothetical protein
LTEERCGTWLVQWGADRFSILSPEREGRSVYSFHRIILPVDLVIDSFWETGMAVLKVDPYEIEEILAGTSKPDLARFKRRLSGEVFDAVRQLPYGCSDCAAEAGKVPMAWSGNPCPGCRENYCRGVRCLRRLRVVLLDDGRRVCRYCGTENGRTVPVVPGASSRP